MADDQGLVSIVEREFTDALKDPRGRRRKHSKTVLAASDAVSKAIDEIYNPKGALKGNVDESNIDDAMAIVGNSLYAKLVGIEKIEGTNKDILRAEGLKHAQEILGRETYARMRQELLYGGNSEQVKAAIPDVKDLVANYLVTITDQEWARNVRAKYGPDEVIAAQKKVGSLVEGLTGASGRKARYDILTPEQLGDVFATVGNQVQSLYPLTYKEKKAA